MLPQIPVVRLTDSQEIPLPTYADGVGTCMILRSNETKSVKIAPQHFEIFSTGFSMALPIGMEAQVRSLKQSTKTGVIVLNAPLTVDASDRGEIKVCLFNASQESVIIKEGDPIALMVFSLALRAQWQDLTAQVVTKIQETQAQNDEQIRQQEIEKELLEQAVTSQIIEGQQDDETPLSADELMEESVQNEVTSEPLEEKAFDGDALQEAQMNEEIGKETPNIPAQEQMTQQLEESEEILQDDNPLLDSPITPPAILEEFEKIENDFESSQTEDKI